MTAQREAELMATGQALAENVDKDKLIERLICDLAKSEASVKVWIDKHAELAERLREKEAK